jgi:hypothetical protein
VDPVQPPGRAAARDPVRPEPERHELRERDDAVLTPRERRDRPVDRGWDHFLTSQVNT